MADYSGSILTGGVSQTGALANGGRRQLTFQNTSDTAMWGKFGAAAVADTGFYIAPNSSVVFDRQTYPNIGNAFNVICATAGKKYTSSDDTTAI